MTSYLRMRNDVRCLCGACMRGVGPLKPQVGRPKGLIGRRFVVLDVDLIQGCVDMTHDQQLLVSAQLS